MTPTLYETKKIREDHRLRVFGNKMLRNVIASEREDVLRKFREVELHDFVPRQILLW